MELIQPFSLERLQKDVFPRVKRVASFVKEKSLFFLHAVKMLGAGEEMEEYELRKLKVFNQLNFLQLIAGILFPLFGLLSSTNLPGEIYIVACLPALVSLVVLWLINRQKHDLAFAAYFILYPFFTCVVYMYGLNPGIGLFYILYGILSVFFLKDTGYMLFSLGFSLVSYFLLSVVIKEYVFEIQTINYGLYLFNQGIALLFIFFGLFLIKKENNNYQAHILEKNTILQEKNIHIHEQTAELAELNSVKNKMFGIISHDLKMPMYALRNLFRNVQEKRMSATELKKSIPDILNDLNYTVSLMDNLLHWAKAQMDADHVRAEEVNIDESIAEVLQLLNLQAKTKRIHIIHSTNPDVYGLIDKNMNTLVLRNLLSNAIKFTPEYGHITIGAREHHSFLEVYVTDSGAGITAEAIKKINNRDFYTTRGTASESGTGLGLMLCKEFLARNNSQLHIESEPGEGSTFSYSIPKSA